MLAVPVWLAGEASAEEPKVLLPNLEEQTKLGRKLPRGYLKSAREVVRTLRESLDKSAGPDLDFRKQADVAKGGHSRILGRLEECIRSDSRGMTKAFNQLKYVL